MKKFLSSLLIWGVIATASYGSGYLASKMLFHLNFTTKIVNPVPTQGKEFELANKLDRVVQLTAQSAEETAAKSGGVVAVLAVGILSISRVADNAARNHFQLRSRYQSLLSRVASMKVAYRKSDMEEFTAIATDLAQESQDEPTH